MADTAVKGPTFVSVEALNGLKSRGSCCCELTGASVVAADVFVLLVK